MECFLFKDLSVAEKELALNRLGNPIEVKKGQELYIGGSLGIIAEGHGSIKRKSDDGHSVTVRTINAGEIFGSASIFGSWKEGKSSIIALCDCKVFYLTEARLKEIMSEFPVISFNYISYLTDRIRFLNNRVDTFSADNTSSRIFEFLQALARDGKAEIDFGMAELARRLNIGRTSLYRGLDALEQDGFITRQKNTIFIKKGEI